jgi:hypothetical protein
MSEKAFTESQVESASSLNEDDKKLQELGYVPSFKREFTNLATVSVTSAYLSFCNNTDIRNFRLASPSVSW